MHITKFKSYIINKKVIGLPKTIIIIMEKTKTVFLSSDLSGVNHEMLAYANDKDEIFINIYDSENDNGYDNQFICLDLLTAIKFVKHLKKEIAYIKDMEVNNG